VVEALLDQCTDVDCLVLQHRHGQRLDRILTGSTIAGLAARAPVRIVSVPEQWEGAQHEAHVTVALGDHDDGSREEVLLSFGFAEAEARTASLTVLHAWYLPAEYGDAAIDRRTLEHWQELARRELEARIDPWREAHPSVDVRVEVPHMRQVDAIVQASRHSDLLLVARRRSHGLVHLGSVVRTAVRTSQCPLVVLTPDTEVRADATHAFEEASAP
jgi:nucleotide-binding universal stress UspA family protein